MPFGPAWSGTVYAMIRRAAGGVGLSPEPLVHRADEINRPGRITDQIVQAINEAEVIVADISGLNPNVMWELGYAHAMGKPVVLMNQDVHASPFDIRDYRQVIYSSSPTDADEELLARSLRAALETD
jgi:nucleoside 2-deoxyribosyltransferase